MKPGKDHPVLPGITVLLAVLISAVSLVGMFSNGFYAKESFNWQIQALGQDEIDLFIITPLLLITGINFSKNNKISSLLWAGTLLYLVYTFAIYCFDVHFNYLFPVYCVILGLSFYSFLWVIYKLAGYPPKFHAKGMHLVRVNGIYFIMLSVVFYLLWLSEIGKAIFLSTIPDSVAKSGLPTNPVHVIDISIFLPAMFLTGIFVLKRKPMAFVFANILLCFFLLMDITIAWLSVKMNHAGLTSGPRVTIMMIIVAFASLVLFIINTIEGNHKKMASDRAGNQHLQHASPQSQQF